MPYSRRRVLCLAALCVVVVAPAASSLASDRESTASVRIGQTTASLTRTRNGVRVSVTTPPSGRQARVQSAGRARWQRMAVQFTPELAQYKEFKSMQADIKQRNAEALAQRQR